MDGGQGARGQNRKPAPAPLPVITGSTLGDEGRGVTTRAGTLMARRRTPASGCSAAVDRRGDVPFNDGGGGRGSRGRTPCGAPVLQPPRKTPVNTRMGAAIRTRIDSSEHDDREPNASCGKVDQVLHMKRCAARGQDHRMDPGRGHFRVRWSERRGGEVESLIGA